MKHYIKPHHRAGHHVKGCIRKHHKVKPYHRRGHHVVGYYK